jgi:hypothetical protein
MFDCCWFRERAACQLSRVCLIVNFGLLFVVSSSAAPLAAQKEESAACKHKHKHKHTRLLTRTLVYFLPQLHSVFKFLLQVCCSSGPGGQW